MCFSRQTKNVIIKPENFIFCLAPCQQRYNFQIQDNY